MRIAEDRLFKTWRTKCHARHESMHVAQMKIEVESVKLKRWISADVLRVTDRVRTKSNPNPNPIP